MALAHGVTCNQTTTEIVGQSLN